MGALVGFYLSPLLLLGGPVLAALLAGALGDEVLGSGPNMIRGGLLLLSCLPGLAAFYSGLLAYRARRVIDDRLLIDFEKGVVRHVELLAPGQGDRTLFTFDQLEGLEAHTYSSGGEHPVESVRVVFRTTAGGPEVILFDRHKDSKTEALLKRFAEALGKPVIWRPEAP